MFRLRGVKVNLDSTLSVGSNLKRTANNAAVASAVLGLGLKPMKDVLPNHDRMEDIEGWALQNRDKPSKKKRSKKSGRRGGGRPSKKRHPHPKVVAESTADFNILYLTMLLGNRENKTSKTAVAASEHTSFQNELNKVQIAPGSLTAVKAEPLPVSTASTAAPKTQSDAVVTMPQLQPISSSTAAATTQQAPLIGSASAGTTTQQSLLVDSISAEPPSDAVVLSDEERALLIALADETIRSIRPNLVLKLPRFQTIEEQVIAVNFLDICTDPAIIERLRDLSLEGAANSSELSMLVTAMEFVCTENPKLQEIILEEVFTENNSKKGSNKVFASSRDSKQPKALLFEGRHSSYIEGNLAPTQADKKKVFRRTREVILCDVGTDKIIGSTLLKEIQLRRAEIEAWDIPMEEAWAKMRSPPIQDRFALKKVMWVAGNLLHIQNVSAVEELKPGHSFPNEADDVLFARYVCTE